MLLGYWLLLRHFFCCLLLKITSKRASYFQALSLKSFKLHLHFKSSSNSILFAFVRTNIYNTFNENCSTTLRVSENAMKKVPFSKERKIKVRYSWSRHCRRSKIEMAKVERRSSGGGLTTAPVLPPFSLARPASTGRCLHFIACLSPWQLGLSPALQLTLPSEMLWWMQPFPLEYFAFLRFLPLLLNLTLLLLPSHALFLPFSRYTMCTLFSSTHYLALNRFSHIWLRSGVARLTFRHLGSSFDALAVAGYAVA